MSEARKYEQEDLNEDQEEVLEEVAVLDDASAEYMLRRIREAEDQYERMEAWYENQKAKAKQLRDRTVGWAMRGLRSYLDMVPTKNGKTQRSYELPGGKIVVKAQEPKYDQDDKELIPWLKQNKMTDMIRIKEESNWKELKNQLKLAPDGKSMVTADGEIVPGVKVTQRGEKMTISQQGKTFSMDGDTVTVK